MWKQLVKDVAIAPLAGYLATGVMERTNMVLYQYAEPEADRERETEVRPGPPFRIGADKTLRLVGIKLNDAQLDKAGMALHYLLPISWAPTYALTRRATGLGPMPAGLASGAAMSVIVDEGITPLAAFSAPNRDYPLSTHVRAFAAHLVFGLIVAAVTEAAWCLMGRHP
jgi:hypothetical protein